MPKNIDKTAPVTITRPNDTTAYTAGDVFGANASTAANVITLNVGSDVNAYVVGGQAISSVSQATLQFDALFFSENPGVIAADNLPFSPGDATMQNTYLGRISFSSFLALGQNSICDGIPASTKPIVVTPNITTLYVVYVVTAAYTPTANEQLTTKFDFMPMNG